MEEVLENLVKVMLLFIITIDQALNGDLSHIPTM